MGGGRGSGGKCWWWCAVDGEGRELRGLGERGQERNGSRPEAGGTRPVRAFHRTLSASMAGHPWRWRLLATGCGQSAPTGWVRALLPPAPSTARLVRLREGSPTRASPSGIRLPWPAIRPPPTTQLVGKAGPLAVPNESPSHPRPTRFDFSDRLSRRPRAPSPPRGEGVAMSRAWCRAPLLSIPVSSVAWQCNSRRSQGLARSFGSRGAPPIPG
jgi:hypothetical protein